MDQRTNERPPDVEGRRRVPGDCRFARPIIAAHVRQPYVVENTPNQLLVTVNNGASPFTLAVQPNGTLAGSGSADVVGRVVTGSTQNEITYASKTGRCAIGTVVPKGGTTTAQIGH